LPPSASTLQHLKLVFARRGKFSYDKAEEQGIAIAMASAFFRRFSCTGKTDSSERSESEAQPLTTAQPCENLTGGNARN